MDLETTTCPRCGSTIEVIDGELWPHPRPGENVRCPGSREPDWLVELRPHLPDIELAVSRELGRAVQVWIDEDFPQLVLTLDHERSEGLDVFRIVSAAIKARGQDPHALPAVRMQNVPGHRLPRSGA